MSAQPQAGPEEDRSPESLFRELMRSIGFRTDFLTRFFGATGLLAVNTVIAATRRPFGFREIVRQMYAVGVKGLTIVWITSIFVGMVLALQFAYGLERFGAQLYVAKLVALSLFREMGPVLTALLVGGKVGAGMSAELGSMSVTEQIDAVRALGANPVKKLVVPRVIATTLMLPVLAIYADVIGILGGLIVCVSEVDMTPTFYLQSVSEAVVIGDVLHGVAKTIFFGFAIGLIGCYQGLRTTGGTEGVGKATTTTVVMVSISILISDYFLSKIFWLVQ